jgi:hypothetical protein
MILEQLLDALSLASERANDQLRSIAFGLVELDRERTMRAFVDELHRRFMYAPDPVRETIASEPPSDSDYPIDIDEACVFVAALGRAVGIPCYFMAARYSERQWTLFLAYEDESGRRIGVDVLRQKTTSVSFEEIVSQTESQNKNGAQR